MAWWGGGLSLKAHYMLGRTKGDANKQCSHTPSIHTHTHAHHLHSPSRIIRGVSQLPDGLLRYMNLTALYPTTRSAHARAHVQHARMSKDTTNAGFVSCGSYSQLKPPSILPALPILSDVSSNELEELPPGLLAAQRNLTKL